MLARCFGLLSALRAPSMLLPDPDRLERLESRLRKVRECPRERGWRAAQAMMPRPNFLKVANDPLRNSAGGRRIARHVAPP